MIYNKINITTSVFTVQSIINDIENVNLLGLDIQPDYQRGFIWKDDYKNSLILSLILNYPIGNIVINQLDKPNEKNAKSELVDGKQRLMTIIDFVSNEYLIKGGIVNDIIKTIAKIYGSQSNDELSRLLKKKTLRFRDLPLPIQRNILNYNLPTYTMNSADKVQITEYFKVLQNQDKLKAGEIINSFPDNKLSKYFDQIGYDLLKNLNYESLDRADLEKIYYSIIGVITKELSLGVSDKYIIKYVETLDELSEEEITIIKQMNDNLGYILSCKQGLKHRRGTKRLLKYILLISGLHKDYFKENTLDKLILIADLNSKLAAFNSDESDENKFSKYFADEYSIDKEKFLTETSVKYRKIYSISSKTASYSSVVDSINTLVTIIDEKM